MFFKFYFITLVLLPPITFMFGIVFVASMNMKFIIPMLEIHLRQVNTFIKFITQLNRDGFLYLKQSILNGLKIVSSDSCASWYLVSCVWKCMRFEISTILLSDGENNNTRINSIRRRRIKHSGISNTWTSSISPNGNGS